MAQFTRTQDTTSEEVTEALKDHIKGKTILITGVTPGGIGAACALALAAHNPGLLILAARNSSKILQTASEIQAKYPNVTTRALVIDLASLASVRAAAAELRAVSPPLAIDALINNAAIMACPYSVTVDGIELQLATNHIGHFVFTLEILPLVMASHDKRVVNVSSIGHTFARFRWDDTGFSGGEKYEPWEAYSQSKIANVLFSVGLADRLGKKGLRTYSLHPGCIETNLQIYQPRELLEGMVKEFEVKYPGFHMKTLSQGAATHIVAAFDPSLEEHNGAYLEDCHVSPQAEWAKDPADAERLWKLTEKMIGKEYNP